jgi:hypothetical protein
MGDHDEGSVGTGVTLKYGGDRSLEPGQDFLVSLGADERPTLFFGQGEEFFGECRVASFLFGPGVTLKDAAVAFYETRYRHHLSGEASLACGYLGGLERPRERTRIDA